LALVQQVGDKAGLAALLQEQSFQTEDYETASTLLEKALSLSREIGNFFFAAFQLQLLGDRARIHGDLSRAAEWYTESLGLLLELNVRPRMVYPIGNLGRIAFLRGDYAQARRAYEASISLARDLGYKTAMADWSLRLAEVTLHQEDFAQARTTLQETLMLCRDIGNQSELTEALVLSAGLALAMGQTERAARLLGAAEIALAQHQTVLEPSTQTRFEDYVTTTQSQVDPVAFQSAYTEGQRQSLDQAIDDALALS
jgi:tetratricopeptide (TPR) repeat protein